MRPMANGPDFPSIALLWPAFAAISAGEATSAMAREFVDLALGPSEETHEPLWTSRNTVALELRSVRLREFTAASNEQATLICAPFALHGASVADFAPGHSLVGVLLEAGLPRLFVTDWCSADPEMSFFSIDTYLADLNVLVDELGGCVNLVGLCQGGWMSLAYAARFPGKVNKLALAGAPIDIAAVESIVARAAQETPLAIFRELVDAGEGRMLGRHALQFWGSTSLDPDAIQKVLQSRESPDSESFGKLQARFTDWYAWTVDLPGTFYLEVVERLFKQNQLADGRFAALGKIVNLADMRNPLCLLAGGDDEVAPPAQLFAAEHLVGTPNHQVWKMTAPCSHLGLFMGSNSLTEYWPRIAHWLASPKSEEKQVWRPYPHQRRSRHRRACSSTTAL